MTRTATRCRRTIGIAGTLYFYRERVRIVVSRFEATHPRLAAPNAVSTLPQHRAEMVAAVSGKRGKRYLKRQHLLDVGEPALAYLTECQLSSEIPYSPVI